MNQPLFQWRRLALVTCVGLLGSSPAFGELKPGDKAPEFRLPGSDGKVYASDDLLNKKVVVIAWFPKAFTGG
jgi:peroxiredoxin Q/BCP